MYWWCHGTLVSVTNVAVRIGQSCHNRNAVQIPAVEALTTVEGPIQFLRRTTAVFVIIGEEGLGLSAAAELRSLDFESSLEHTSLSKMGIR